MIIMWILQVQILSISLQAEAYWGQLRLLVNNIFLFLNKDSRVISLMTWKSLNKHN